MRNYAIGIAMLTGALGGATTGYNFSDYATYLTKYTKPKIETKFTKKASGTVLGATGGMIGAALMTLLLKHYIEMLPRK